MMAVAFIGLTAQSQISLPKVDTKSAEAALGNFVKPPAIGDIGKTTGSIVETLTQKLSLPASTKTGLTDAVGGFLKDKSGIMNLVGDPTKYLAKFNPLQSGLFSKIKGVVGAAKFADFLKLKPSGGGAGNVLSHLFF